jgi:hypothetical protein
VKGTKAVKASTVPQRKRTPTKKNLVKEVATDIVLFLSIRSV